MAVVFILMLSSPTLEAQALVHGKNSDGTLKEKQENSKEKIQTFLAVPKCFPEWFMLPDEKIFGYWIEIIVMKTEQSQKPIFGVAIYKEKYGKYKNESSKNKAIALSRANYKILKHLMKMMSDKMIDPKLHLDSQDIKIHEYVQKDVEENCKKFDNNDNEEEKIILNNVHYELAMYFEFNQWKELAICCQISAFQGSGLSKCYI
uniref:Uncharacterized protein n=1 Tax=Globodera pallida TaxID=36090 RepID=A0A183CD46_GLOPA